MLIGQDESTYHQYTFSKRYWKNCTGRNFITPKSEGEMLMVSAFQAREFGFGLGDHLTPEVYSKVNEIQRDEDYKAKDDAKLIKNCTKKTLLTDDPSLLFFESGANKEGYWTNLHVKLQLEDIFDCLTVIFPEFDFIVLFDQSLGHCKLRKDSLNVNNMNVSYGGRVPNMHTTIINATGTYNKLLGEGDIQNLTFVEGDAGPFWTSAEERETSKNDVLKDGVLR